MQRLFHSLFRGLSWPKISQFLAFNHYARAWVLTGLILVGLGFFLYRFRRFVRRHAGKLAVVLCAVLVAASIIAWPRLSFYLNTQVTLPSYLSAQEKQQFRDRRQEAINDKESWGKNNSGLYNNIGIIRSAVRDYSGAVDSFSLAIKKNPDDPRFWRNIAITYTYEDKFSEAEAAFLQVFKMAPQAPEYWLELGELYQFKIKDNAKARSFYLEAMSRSNSNISVAQAYANFLENQEKDYPGAITYWQIVADGLSEPQKSTFTRHISELKVLHGIK